VKKLLPAANAIIAVIAGGLVLLGTFFPTLFGDLRQYLLQWAIILAALALWLGVLNLLSVHWKKVRQKETGAGYSAVLVFFLLGTIAVVVLDIFLWSGGPVGTWSQWVFNNLQKPVEISLLALLAVVLAYAAARLLSRRNNTFSIVFLASAVTVMLLMAPVYFLKTPSILDPLRQAISGVLAVAGARGLLLGVALGTVAAALRVLMGTERPYGG